MNSGPIVSLLAASLLASVTALPATAAGPGNIMFILDASNSMWGQIDGQPKIEIAKSVLANLVRDLPEGTSSGLIAYGHRFDFKLKDCDDMELVSGWNPNMGAEIDQLLSYVTPKGQTPIAQTLTQSIGWVQMDNPENPTVVLITDGVETCDGDPCRAATALADAGIGARVHVVGFDLSPEERAKVECISANGNGKYFDAQNADELQVVMADVKREAVVSKPIVVAQVESPAEPDPVAELFFEDEFDGDDLTEGWEVENPNPDRYIAEAGELLMIAGVPASKPGEETMENIISHGAALPDGDWEIEVSFKLEAQNGWEAFHFGVRNDFDGWMAAGIKPSLEYGDMHIRSFIEKNESGKLSNFEITVQNVRDNRTDGSTERWRNGGLGDKYSQKDFILVLRKSGRSYSMSGTYGTEGDDDYKSFKSESLKMLRGKKNLFVAFGLRHDDRDSEGEGSVSVNYVRVNSISN